jgi:NAD(P)H dehydrogenase (quinone)
MRLQRQQHFEHAHTMSARPDATPAPAHPTVLVAVVHHSGYGHTTALADAVARGASRVPGAQVRSFTAEEAQANLDVLDRADAHVWGSPTYMAGIAWPMQRFFEATSGRWAAQAWKDKLAAGFTNSGSVNGDKLATLQHMVLVAMQHGMHWVGLGLLPGGDGQPNRLGSFIGAMAHSPHGAVAESAPPPADRVTAELLGERVARAALDRRQSAAPANDEARRAITRTLVDYFDGLYSCDTARLARAFHPSARYVNATDGGVPNWSLDEYLPVVAKREPPAARGEVRKDRILSIDFAGDRAALARVACAIGERSFVDLLTLLRDDAGAWRIVSKVFHYDVVAANSAAPAPTR